MTRPTIAEVIAELEAATGPSDRLDALIHIAIVDPAITLYRAGDGTDIPWPVHDGLASDLPLDRWDDWEGLARIVGAPGYTRSIDAARSLVPAGWGWDVSVYNGVACASTSRPMSEYTASRPIYSWVENSHGSAPIALCIVALRFRALLPA